MKQETADLVTFTEEFLSGKLCLLCSVMCQYLTDYKGQFDIKISFSFVPLFILMKLLFNKQFKSNIEYPAQYSSVYQLFAIL